MNIFILILVGIAGVVVGTVLARRRKTKSFIEEQVARKAENKKKILEFLASNERVKNDDVEKLLGVSNATAERYLDELEKEGKLTQHGEIGRSVFYTKNNK